MPREPERRDLGAHDIAALFRSGCAGDGPAHSQRRGVTDRVGHARHHRPGIQDELDLGATGRADNDGVDADQVTDEIERGLDSH